MEYYIGQIFVNPYPPEAAKWCNANNAYIDDYDETHTIIKANPEETPEEREALFLKDFFKLKYKNNDVYYRKKPKGYSSAVESLNTAFNAVTLLGKLEANTLIFYQKPDFTKAEECTEEWLIAHQTFNEEMTAQEFTAFYVNFMTAWNAQEH